jgi:hypothetical protein
VDCGPIRYWERLDGEEVLTTMADSYEEQQQALDPHRREEQRRAREEAEDRLRDRGIEVHARDSDEDLADLLDSVERFEVIVESHGGDLLVDRIGSSEPDDPAFVLPVRALDESVTDYRLRVEAATDRLRHHRQT